MNLINRLVSVLAPQGILTVTTGGDEIGRFLGARWGSTDPVEVAQTWIANFSKVADAKAIIVGVPCDVGAGFERGSFKGPLAIRTALLAAGMYDRFDAAGVVDIGDIRVNPQLLDDSYYTPEVLDRVREARSLPADAPVSPLSALRAVLDDLGTLSPGAPVLVLGGDHSLSRVPVDALVARGNAAQDLGVLHFDAHTDLLDLRDGVPYNFATWAYHANDAIGRGRRLVQVGVRVSGRSREEWEQTLDLRQMRMDEIDGRDHAEVAAEIVAGLKAAGVTRVYVSNDIDATDPTFAASTGTMEPHGLHPNLICTVLAAVAAEFTIVGSDVVEVAPPLKWHVPGEPARTIRTACRYVVAQLNATLDQPLENPFEENAAADLDVVLATPSFT